MDMNRELIMNLRDIGHMLRILYEGKGSQKRVLILLHESGSMTQRELTGRMGIQPGSASEVLGKLEYAGMIRREPSAEDRRTARVYLTEEGRRQAAEAARQRQNRHQEMFSCLSDEEKETLLALTEKLNNDWNSRYQERKNEYVSHARHENYHNGHYDRYVSGIQTEKDK